MDIFLPICGEDILVLQKTWEAVSTMRENYFGRVNVVIGDDKQAKEAHELSKIYDFKYLSRANKGFMKKTGNLDFLFENSFAPLVVVFDADFCPVPEFLNVTVPKIINKPNVGILQTPQEFFPSSNKFEQAASDSQFDFYRIIQPSRNQFGASICVGSNAVFRREAIEGTKVYDWLISNKIDHGEDVNTGFYLNTKGWKTEFLDWPLAYGRSAENLKQLIKQRERWCSSSSKMFLSGIVLSSDLGLIEKICFYTGFLYYLSDPIKLMLNYMLFVILVFHGDNLNLVNSLWFIPHIAFGLILLPLSRGKLQDRYSRGASVALTYINTYTLVRRIFGIGANWVPTGAVNNKDKAVTQVRGFIIINFLFYTTLTIVLSVLGKIHYSNIGALSVIFWIVVFIIDHVNLLTLFIDKKNTVVNPPVLSQTLVIDSNM